MAARLVLLARVPEPKPGEGSEAFIILLPGIGTDPPSKWDDFACNDPRSWIGEAATRMERKTAVYEFEHKLTVEDLRYWDTIISKGDQLLDSLIPLAQEASDMGAQNVRFAFICHSLGGIFLKSALVKAKRRGDSASSGVLDSLTGIVFLSTPHLRDDNQKLWSNAIRILHSRSKRVLVGDPIAGLECIATLSQNFENLTLPSPTLSIYERKSTKLISRFPANDQNRSYMLVPFELAETGTGLEFSLGIDADHHKVCRLIESLEERKQVVAFAAETFDKDAAERPSISQLRKTISSTQKGCDSPGSDTDTENQYTTGDREFAVSASMEDLASHPNVALLQEPDHTTPALFQHGDQRGSTSTQPSRINIADAVNPVLSMSDIPQTRQEAPDPNLPCILVEPGVHVKDFSGREDTRKTLRQALVKSKQNSEPETGGLSTFVLCGLGGIGKTSVAADFVWTCHSEKLFDAIFWIRADSVGKIRDAFSRIAVKLQLQPGRQGRDRHLSTKLVLEWLRNPVKSFNPAKTESKMKASWLIVYDNVDKHDILSNFWPICATGSILMTSRDPVTATFETEVLALAKTDAKQQNSIMMQPFSSHEAVSFLTRLCGQDQNDDQDDAAAAQVVDVLDRIPLALRQMAGIIKYRDMSFKDFMRLYNDEGTHSDLFAEKVTLQTADYQYNLSTVWGLRQLEQDSAALMSVLSLLDPDHISEDLLEVAKDPHIPDFPTDYGSYTKARAKLWRLSLISRIKKRQELKIHRIVQAAARSKMTPDEWCAAFKTACALLFASWPKNKRVWNYTTNTWNDCDKILPHTFKLVDHYEHFQHNRKDLDDTDFVRLLIYSGWYYHDRGNSDDAKPFFELAKDISKRLGDTGYDTMSEIHSSQGAIATETNDAEGSMEHYKKLMHITERQYGTKPSPEGDINLAIASNELGIAQFMNNDNDDALRNFMRARTLVSNHLMSDERASRFFYLSSTNLSLVYWVRNRMSDAKKVLERALEMSDEQTPFENNDSFIYGRLYHALGNVYESLGNDERALEWHEKAFKHYENTIGIDHHRTADVAVRLADHHRKQNLWETANHYLSLAEKVFRSKSESCYQPELARLMQRKSLLLRAQGDTKNGMAAESEARSLYNQVFAIRQRSQPDGDVLQEDYDQLVTFWSR